MTEAWKERQLKWLAIGHEVRRREVDSSVEFEEFPEPGSSQVALLQIFTDTLDGNTTPATAAKQISDWVLSVPDSGICYDINRAYANMMGVLFSATSEFSSRKHLGILADLTVELANQPDAYNHKDKPLEFESGSIVVPPGEDRGALHNWRRIMVWTAGFCIPCGGRPQSRASKLLTTLCA